MRLTTPAQAAKGPDELFTGDVYVSSLKKVDGPSKLIASIVRFTPGARTNWHAHHLGQTLLCTDGLGVVVTRDGTVIRLRPGDTVWTAPGEEHWHGAAVDCTMSHLAMLEGTDDGDGTTWLEPVTEEQYASANGRS